MLTFAELSFAFNLQSVFSSYQDKYFIFFLQKRATLDRYIGNYSIQSNISAPCDRGSPQNFLELNSLNNATLRDITENVTIIDWDHDPSGNSLINKTFLGWKFFDIDLSMPGPDTVNLAYNYIFDTFASFQFCTEDYFLDSEYKAYNLIPGNLSCSDNFPSYTTADCGTYFNNTYKVCLLLELMTLKNGTKLSTLGLSNTEACPLNSIGVSIKPNPKVNLSNINSPPLLMELIYNTLNTGPITNSIDKTLVLDFNKFAAVGMPFNMTQPDSLYPYHDESKKFTYVVGEKYGLASPFLTFMNTRKLTDYVNDTFYLNTKYLYKFNNSVKYLPYPFQDTDDGNKYYFFSDSSNLINITFTSFSFPSISPKCFQNIFNANKITALFNFFSTLGINFFDEVLKTVNAWLFAKLFIGLWGYFKIRFFILLEKKNISISQVDMDSEKITKYTFKCLSFCVFVVLFVGVLKNRSSFNNIAFWSEKIVQNKCFQDEFVNNLFDKTMKFALEVRNTNDKLIFCFLASFGVEMLTVLVYFIYDYTDNKPLVKEIQFQEEELKKKN